jgi:hypothetical protein
MHCFGKSIPFVVVAVLLLATWVTSDCHADCMACWQLKGVFVLLNNDTKIEGYAAWNDSWAAHGYQGSSAPDENSIKQALENMKEFPGVVFDPKAQINKISVYTHLRSIKYPVANALVATSERVRLSIKEIKDLKLNPGPHDGYDGAGQLPLVSTRIADLLQTKPSASCEYGEGTGDMYLVSYDQSFPAEELQRICQEHLLDKELEKKLEARDIFSLYYAYD